MKLRAPALEVIAVILGFLLLNSPPLRAQSPGVTVTGTITDSSGRAVPNAMVSVRNVSTGHSKDTHTDSAGRYSVTELVPGEFEVSISTEKFKTKVVKVTFAPGAKPTLDMVLSDEAQPQTQGNAAAPESQKPANPAPGKPGEPTLEDLGFPTKDSVGSVQDQARLDKRSHMLKLHQRFGLIATAPLVASVITSFGAGGRSTSKTDRYLHLALGSATGDLYFLSAYYAIRAPRISGTQTRGPIRAHKILAWIHGPGMIMTPILGAIAFDQKSKGEKVHGIAMAHGPVAIVTAAAYGAAILTVSFKF